MIVSRTQWDKFYSINCTDGSVVSYTLWLGLRAFLDVVMKSITLLHNWSVQTD